MIQGMWSHRVERVGDERWRVYFWDMILDLMSRWMIASPYFLVWEDVIPSPGSSGVQMARYEGGIF